MIVAIAIYPTQEHEVFGPFDSFDSADTWIAKQRQDVRWIVRQLRVAETIEDELEALRKSTRMRPEDWKMEITI